jgi:hypothetical protein
VILIELLFGCLHMNTSRPFTLRNDRGRKETYQRCLDCGAKLPYTGPLAYPNAKAA